MTRLRRARKFLWRTPIFFSAVAFLLGVAECFARVIHCNTAPLLPYSFNNYVPYLPAELDIKAQFRGQNPVRYCTDIWSCRISTIADSKRSLRAGLLTIGDSQALGYGMEYDDTFTARVAVNLCGSARHTKILAAPAADLDTQYLALRRSMPKLLDGPNRLVVCINLGNDLDESYFQGLDASFHASTRAHTWLLQHSFLYMDYRIIVSNLGEKSPPGLNPVLYALADDERVILIDAIYERVTAIMRLLPQCPCVVVLIPCDYQVDSTQFKKYQQYYEPGDFEQWDARIPSFASKMAVLEGYLINRLRTNGIEVLTVSDMAASHPATEIFEPTSHHLTTVAHAWVAEQLIRIFTR